MHDPILVTNKSNSRTGNYDKLTTWLLLGEMNTQQSEISIQITDVQPNGMQGLHRHSQVQCYYIVQGQGEVLIDGASKVVNVGDAILIPSNAEHGIRNMGATVLQYLTANRCFASEVEKQTWSESELTL